jgi:hypothetical protein
MKQGEMGGSSGGGGVAGQHVSALAATSREREALQGIVEKYGLKAEDVEALLAWRASHDF